MTRITVSDQDEAGTLYPSVFAPVVNCSWEVAGALRGPDELVRLRAPSFPVDPGTGAGPC